MTTTRIYKSTDSGAPVLVGGASSLIDLLDKCLVTGYGSKTAAGWTKPFTGTNKAAFRNSLAAGGTGMYLRVSDAGSGTGGAREALVRGYMTMSDVDTGTIETPTAAQLAASVVWRKSDTVDSTARPWILVADERTFYLTIDTGTSSNGNGCYGAGDFESYIAGEAYPFFVGGRYTQVGAGSNAAGVVDGGMMIAAGATLVGDPYAGTWVPRGYAGSGDPIRTALMCPTLAAGAYIGGDSAMANPSLGSSLLFYMPAFIVAEGAIRGRLRGVHVPLNTHAGVAAGTEIVNPPGLTATLVAFRHFCTTTGSGTTTDGHLYIDRTSVWP